MTRIVALPLNERSREMSGGLHYVVGRSADLCLSLMAGTTGAPGMCTAPGSLDTHLRYAA